MTSKVYLRREVQLILSYLMRNKDGVLRPTLHPDGYRYPVEKVIGKRKVVEQVLEELHELGILERETCGVLVACPNCGSMNVLDVKLLQHRECGWVGTEEDVRGDVCPGCGRRVKEFVKVLGFACMNCGNRFLHDEAVFKQVYSYRISEKKFKEVVQNIIIAPVAEFFAEHEYDVEAPGKLAGESGVEHTFDVVARRDGETVVVDIHFPKQPGEQTIIRMFAKMFDVKPTRAIIVAVPRMSEVGKRLAESYKIDLIEAGGVNEVARKLEKIVGVESAKPGYLDVMTLLSLPDHLRKTATAVCKLGRATADEVADETGRTRAMESAYLNQLVRMGYLKKERVGRKVYFHVEV